MIKDVEKRTAVRSNAEFVGTRVENTVQTGVTAATKAATTVQERIAAIA